MPSKEAKIYFGLGIGVAALVVSPSFRGAVGETANAVLDGIHNIHISSNASAVTVSNNSVLAPQGGTSQRECPTALGPGEVQVVSRNQIRILGNSCIEVAGGQTNELGAGNYAVACEEPQQVGVNVRQVYLSPPLGQIQLMNTVQGLSTLPTC